MKPFFIEDEFYTDIESYLIAKDLELEDIQKLPDDYKLAISDCDLEPMFQLNASTLSEILCGNYEERFSEDSPEADTIEKALSECIDFEKLNALIPQLWYINGKEAELTKQELLDAC